jgi:hypothetical protein
LIRTNPESHPKTTTDTCRSIRYPYLSALPWSSLFVSCQQTDICRKNWLRSRFRVVVTLVYPRGTLPVFKSTFIFHSRQRTIEGEVAVLILLRDAALIWSNVPYGATLLLNIRYCGLVDKGLTPLLPNRGEEWSLEPIEICTPLWRLLFVQYS